MSVNGWENTKLGNILSLEYGSGLGETKRTGYEYPVFGSSGELGRNNEFLVNGPGIIVGRKGSVGSVFWSDSAFWPIDTTYYVVPIRTLDLRWCLWLLKFLPLKSLDSSTGVPGLNRNDAYKIDIEIPSDQAEQHRIAAILDTVDNAIYNTELLITKLKHIEAGLRYDLLTRGIDGNGELRPSYKGAPELYKLTQLGYIPNQWLAGNLDNFCELHNHMREPISAQVRATMKGVYPYYGPTGILDYIDEYRLDGEFVLIGEDGDHFLKYVDWSMTQWVNGKFNVNNHAHIMKGRNGCSTEWLHRFFSHRDITLNLTRQGAGRLKLNKESLLKLGIAVPKLEEQKKISEIISTTERNLQFLIEHLAKLNNLKQGLLHDLLTGHVRVNDIQLDLAEVAK